MKSPYPTSRILSLAPHAQENATKAFFSSPVARTAVLLTALLTAPLAHAIYQSSPASGNLGSVLTGQPYSLNIVWAGSCSGQYSEMNAGGVVPPGLSYGGSGNPTVLSGTPNTPGNYNFSIQVYDPLNYPGCGFPIFNFSMTVLAPLIINTASLSGGTQGAAYSASLSGSNGTLPYTWSLFSGSLPAGLALSSGGTISGTPASSGTSNFTVKLADNGGRTATKALSITITSSLAISTSSLGNGLATSSYSSTLTATGGNPAYTWSLASGTLPTGLSLSAAGVISGTPSAAATFNFTVRAIDTAAGNVTKALAITITPALAITTNSLPAALATSAYTQTVTATGGTSPYSWSVTAGSLPTGLSLTAAGLITGTPTTQGAYNFTVHAIDSTSPTAQTANQPLTIAVGAALSVTTASLANGLATTAYAQGVAASGGTPPYTWSLFSGTLPAGTTLSAAGNITGTPSTAGTYNFTVQATDSTSPTAQTATKALAITIDAALSITTASLPNGLATTAYSQTLTATGGTPTYSWSLSSGALPTGLTLSAAGLISGTPSAAGTYNFTVQASDSTGPTPETATQALAITIGTALSVTTGSLPGGFVTAVYSQSLAATGGTPSYSWSTTAGSVPPGLSLNAAGLISGTPSTVGTYNFTVTATDSTPTVPQTASKALSITTGAALTVTTATLPAGLANTAYSQAVAATGGTPPYSWSLAAGPLPPGLTLNAAGLISGTATSAGSYSFTVQATDSTNPSPLTATRVLSINVGTALAITTASLPNGTAGSVYSQTATATNGTPSYTWSLLSGSLPTGLVISAAGLVGGTPSAAGTYNFTLTVTDSTVPTAQTATQPLSITIGAPLSITTASPLPNGLATSAYSVQLTAAGGAPAYTWALAAGAFPSGLSLSPTGLLSGTPSAPASTTVTVQVTDSTAPTPQTATKALSITIGAGLSVVTTTLPNGQQGSPYSQPLAATGGTAPYTWTLASGTLPTGLNVSGTNLTGTPSTSGIYNFTLRATDSTAPTAQTASQAYTVTIGTSLTVTTTSLPLAVVSSTYNQGLTASGGTQPYSWALTSGPLPSGLSLSAAGFITGAPTAPGVSTFTVQVTDATLPTHQTASMTLTITTNAQLSISTSTVPNAIEGQSYLVPITATGGVPPYSWSVASGTLPAGLALDPVTGFLNGTPTASGSFTVTVKATDTTNAIAVRSFTFTVIPALTITTPTLPNGVTGTIYGQTLTGINGVLPYTWSLLSGALPTGLSLSATGTVAGTPTVPGSYTFTIRLTDSGAPSQTTSAQYSIQITDPLAITTAGLNDGLPGQPYSATLTATGGTAPYLWALPIGALPSGLSLDHNTGVISGTPTTASNTTFTVQVSDATNPPQVASKSLTLAIRAPLTIATTVLPHSRQNRAYTQLLSASGGLQPCTWTVSAGVLPPGLSLDTSGSITGTPTATGTFPFTVRVTDSGSPQQAATQPLTIVSDQAFGIDTAGALAPGIQAVAYTATLSASQGTTPYTWTTIAGSLPAGLSLSTNGVISGIPTTPGSYAFTVQATDSAATPRSAAAALSLTIQPQLILLTTALPDSPVDATYAQPLRTIGGVPPYTWSITSGSLPTGLTLDASGNVAGVTTTAGLYTFTVTVTDCSTPNQTISRALSITVSLGVAITTPSLPDGFVPRLYNQPLAAVGGTQPYTWNVTGGTVPPGLTLTTAGVLLGTPIASGPYTITATVTDSATPAHTASRTYTFQMRDALAITTTTLADAQTGAAYAQLFTAANGTQPYTWSLSSGTTLPPGLALDASGHFTGTPTVPGPYRVSVTVTDTSNPVQQDSHTFPLTIANGFRITTVTIPPGAPNAPYSTTFLATGGIVPYSWTITTGTLPPGLTLAGPTGVLSGTPPFNGNYTFTVQATDSNNATATRVFSLPIGPVLTITTAALADARLGTMYRQTLSAQNGTSPYLWSLTNGTLPTGLVLLASGDIIGQPTQTGTFNITLAVADSAIPPATASRDLSLTVQSGFAISTSSLPVASPAVPYLTTLTAVNGTPPYLFSLTLGSLPTGIKLSSTGVINGTPQTPGLYPLLIQATDASTPTQTTTTQLMLLVTTDLAISTATLPNAIVGHIYNLGLAATNGTVPYTWTADTLPPGLGLLPTGEFYGIASTPGQYRINFTVTDASQPPVTATRALLLRVTRDLGITTTTLPTGFLRHPYSTAITAAGGTPPYTFTATGALPTGLTLASVGILSGTPSQEGSFTITFHVTDATNTSAQCPLTLIVGAKLTATTATLPDAITNTTYYAVLTASGGTPPYNWSIDSLPQGLTLFQSLGLIVGTPQQDGPYTMNVTLNDSAQPTGTATATLPLTVALQLTIPPAELPTTQSGDSYVANFIATGGIAPYRWTADTTTIPAGLTLSTNGTLQGTVNAPPGFASLSLCASDSASTPAHACTIRTLVIGPTFQIDPVTLVPVARGEALTYQLTTTGATDPVSFTSAFALPSGLSLTSNGTIAGTAGTAGTYTLTILATDNSGAIATRDLALSVLPPLTPVTAALPIAFPNQPYLTALVATSGTPPYTWTVSSGSLPTGLNLDASGTIYGTVTSTGTYPLTFTVTDASGATAPLTLSLTAAPALSISAATLPDAVSGVAYFAQLQATAGVTPYTWAITTGTLPAGLMLVADATLSGTPSTPGLEVFTVSVTDASGQTATAPFDINVGDPLTGSGANTTLANATVGVPYTTQLFSNYSAGVSWTLLLGAFPEGLTLDTTGALSGTPLLPGTADFIVRAATADQYSDQKISLTVLPQAGGGAALTVTGGTLPLGLTGRAYTTSLATTGGTPPYSWMLTDGALPPGLALAGSAIAGTPTTAGSYRAVLTVTDATANQATALYSILVSQALTTDNSLGIQQTLGAPLSIPLNVAGGNPPYSWSLTSETLPAGLTIGSSAITGTPTTPGSFALTLTVRDSSQPAQAGTTAISIKIITGLTVTTTTLPTAYPQLPYTTAVSASGGIAPYHWQITTGTLPAGLTLTPDGLITGIPTVTAVSQLTVTVTDASSQSASAPLTLTVICVTITTVSLPAATPNTPYSVILQATGGTPPYKWSITHGSLPTSLTLTPDGLLSGTPTSPANILLTIQAADASGSTAAAFLTLAIGVTNLGALHLSAIPDPLTSATQIPLSITVDNAPSTPVNGTITLTFAPIQTTRDDTAAALLRADGSTTRTAAFSLVPSSVTATFDHGPLHLDTGTLAGTFTLTATLADGRPTPLTTSGVAHSLTTAPVITAATLTHRDAYSLTLSISGYSTTGEVRTANFAFAGSGTMAPPESINVQALFNTWYLSETGKTAGGTFQYTQQLNFTAPATGLTAVSITLANSIGTGQQYKLTF